MTAVSHVVDAMKRIAPLHLAEKWDNVGLIVDVARSAFGGAQSVGKPKVFMTNDLTERVLAEALALEEQPDIIVTYHPTPFRKFKKLGNGDPTGRIVLDLVSRGIAVYSPHTALDSVSGGVNDWLASGVGKGAVTAVQPTEASAADASAPAEGQGRLVAFDEPVPLGDEQGGDSSFGKPAPRRPPPPRPPPAPLQNPACTELTCTAGRPGPPEAG